MAKKECSLAIAKYDKYASEVRFLRSGFLTEPFAGVQENRKVRQHRPLVENKCKGKFK